MVNNQCQEPVQMCGMQIGRKLDDQTDSHSGYSAHLRVVRKSNIYFVFSAVFYVLNAK